MDFLDFNGQPDRPFILIIPEPNGYPHLEARSNEFYRKRN
jgi:hypothetical protein